MTKDLKKISKEFEIVEIEDKDAFVISKQNEKIVIYDEEIIASLIEKKFMEEYKKILYLLTIDEEDDDNTTKELAIYNISYLRELILKEYAKFISKSLLKKYLNMLTILDSKIKFKEVEKGHSR